MKRTGWNKGTDKPVYSKPGFEVYERMYPINEGGIKPCVYRNGIWFVSGNGYSITEKIENAVYWSKKNLSSCHENIPWRGLSSPPKGFKP